MPEGLAPPRKNAATSQKLPKRRRRRACDSCFKKKIQCDAEFPQCNWCKHHNLACVYNRILKQVTRSSPNNQSPLDQTQLTPYMDDHASTAPNLPPTEGLGRFRQGNTILNNLTYLKGRHVFPDEDRRWIQSRVGENVDFERLCALELQWLKPLQLSMGPDMTPPPIPESPSRSNLEKYILRYTSSFQSLVFPVISRPLWVKSLDLAYSPDRSFGSASSKSCLYSFLSLVALFGFDDNIHGAMDCGSYASAAQSFMTQITEEMTVDGLQSLIMLTQLQYFLGDLQSAAVSVSIATRLLYSLGAHTLSTPDTYDKSDLRCHLRDLFWLCYSFDKDICLRTGQPPCIHDMHCNLTLPPEYVRRQDANLQQHTISIDNHTAPLFPWDLRLSKLKSRVYEDLYSASALRKSVPELLSSIRSLDETLEQWRLSLPADFRPTLYFSQKMPVSANLNTQEVMLRLVYYHCVTTIHQASGRCQLSETGTGMDDAGVRFDGIASSVNLSITASRSTLAYLQRALPVVQGECFWIVLSHAITAVLTLFYNVLSNPLDADSYHDVDMLRDVPGLIRRIPIRKFTLGEVIHLKFLDGFTTGLAGLCLSAMEKAKRDAGLSV